MPLLRRPLAADLSAEIVSVFEQVELPEVAPIDPPRILRFSRTLILVANSARFS